MEDKETNGVNVEEIETEILNKTVEIWNMFLGLKQTHPADIPHLSEALSGVQSIIALRMARRTNPEIFITVENNDKN